jgi:twitching motility protein PilU
MEKRGLVLIVGATGSGKSTTIASMLDHRNANVRPHPDGRRPDRIPVQAQEIDRQPARNRHGHPGLAIALKNAMRQAPDCILIGEIRDKETMQAAIAYAQTGHLCLATLHANNAYHALNRIINFFPLENRRLLFLDLVGRPARHHLAAPGQEAGRQAHPGGAKSCSTPATSAN